MGGALTLAGQLTLKPRVQLALVLSATRPSPSTFGTATTELAISDAALGTQCGANEGAGGAHNIGC